MRQSEVQILPWATLINQRRGRPGHVREELMESTDKRPLFPTNDRLRDVGGPWAAEQLFQYLQRLGVPADIGLCVQRAHFAAIERGEEEVLVALSVSEVISGISPHEAYDVMGIWEAYQQYVALNPVPKPRRRLSAPFRHALAGGVIGIAAGVLISEAVRAVFQ